MSKFLRSRHVPLNPEETKAVEEEFSNFQGETQEAGSLLRSLRESQGLSESELGAKVGVDAQHIIMMENGQQPISFSQAVMFGKIFDTDRHLFL